MPVFNCERTLASAIRSILAQTSGDWELLVIDDGSTDHTVAIACGFEDSRVRVVLDGNRNQRLSARLNQGVQLARGRYIARMDGDDLSFPERLERQAAFLDVHPNVDLVGCGMVIFKSTGELCGLQLARSSHQEIVGGVLRSCLLPHATWMGRAEWFRTHRYDTSMKRAEDRDLLLRTRESSCFAGMDDVLYGYRVDRTNISKNATARREYLKSVLSDAYRHRDWLRFLGAGTAEVAKLAIDTVAFATHTDRVLLHHRALQVRDIRVIRDWEMTWHALGQPVEVC